MRISFKCTGLDDTLEFAEVAKIFYLADKKRVVLHSVDNVSYISCAEIEYDEYLEMTKNLLEYGFLDLCNNSFDYYGDTEFYMS